IVAAFTRWIIKNSALSLAIGTVLSLIAGFFTALLYGNLRTHLEELLPSSARSVQDLREIRARLSASSNLAVLVFSKDRQGSKRFIVDLARELETKGRLVSRVEYRIDREIEFFRKRRALFLSLADLHRIRNYARDRISYESKLRNPLNIFSGIELMEPRMDFN